MTADGSKSVVLLASVASVTSAAATLWAAASTGSAALAALGVLFLAAASSQALMLVGLARAKRATHASATCGDLFFWSFVAALILFSLAAGVAVYEGVGKITDAPRILLRSQNAYTALAVAFALTVAAYVRVKLHARNFGGQDERLTTTTAASPVFVATRIETTAALTGLVIAAIGIALSYAWDSRFADGGAAILVGLVVGGVAAIMGIEIRRLLIADAPSAEASTAPDDDPSRKTAQKENAASAPTPPMVEEPAHEREAAREQPAAPIHPASKRASEPHLSRRAKKRQEQQHRRHPQSSDS
ncbi:hypothetical protein W911_09970 [Hyphomicrobium nitrativorans NL23]|uniref:Uncharacterized protein n=1 Tax=Hyphomicrobium nitrativorans NL23 TaxID=1029756 RepID=V5SI12_9HYPH|nr:hypothetical protein [Hyphomicrobium nitrativorans]AHB50178.1 hypothetical protein W911_09970 [Hyphomicrobium nitrativorans NL23]